MENETKLERLLINYVTYGDDKDTYKVSVTVTNPKGTITLNLPKEASNGFVAACAEYIRSFTKNAADDLLQSIVNSLPQEEEPGIGEPIVEEPMAKLPDPVITPETEEVEESTSPLPDDEEPF